MKKTFFAVCILFLTGCSTNPAAPEEISQNPTQDAQLNTSQMQVLASFYPIAYMAEQVAGRAAQVQNIVGAADPHDYSLSPSDIVAFQEADVVLLQGAGLEPWGGDIEEQLSDSGTLTVLAEKIDLIATENAHKEKDEDHDEHEEDRGEEYGDEHEGEHGEGHKDSEGSHDEHDHGAFDPHAWLDPILAQDMIQEIGNALSSADPENASLYAQNAQDLSAQFAELDATYTKALTNCQRQDVVVSHDAFGYLAQRYGFTVHPIAGISTQDEPSAQTLALLKVEAAKGITHILAEETSVNRFAQTLAAETGLEMLPISALASPDSEEDFIDRAKDNLTQIQTALGCNE